MKKLLLTLLFLSVAHAAVAAQVAPKKVDAAAELRRKTFEKAWEIVRDKFYDPSFNGVDWNRTRERYAPLVAAAQTDAELYELLKRMLSELKVSHMGVVTPDALKQLTAPPVTTGLGIRMVEGQIVVMRVLKGSSAEREGVRPGFVVEQVGGAAVKDLDEALAKLHGAPNTKVVVKFLNERDELRELTLERMPLGRGEVERSKLAGDASLYALFEARRLEGGAGYIRFTSFIPALDKKIQEAVASMLDAPGLVIDLRGNGGGDDSVAINLANQLFDKPTQLMVTRTRKGEDFYYKAKPAKRPYLGPVVILVDGASGSASEQLAAGLQESGRAYIVGNVTAGDDMDAELEELPTGAYLIYASGLPHTPKGLVVEGRGVKPDLEVNLTRAGLLQGVDAQLDAALRYIRNQTTSKGSH
ncbi:MAG: S41 family peptidase [Pyrinomonadaceae bacterium]